MRISVFLRVLCIALILLFIISVINFYTLSYKKISLNQKKVLTKEDMQKIEDTLNLRNFTYTNISNKNKILQTHNKYHLRNPSFNQTLAFMQDDDTDNKNYSYWSFNCAHFSRDVNNNSEQQGLICGFVLIETSDAPHALVVFNTTDEGLVFFEPQTDEIVNLEIGKKYWSECLGYSEGNISSDFIVEKITIYW